MNKIIEKKYDFVITNTTAIENSTGSEVFCLDTTKGKYILKRIDNNSMNKPENEKSILDALGKNNIPVAKLIRTEKRPALLLEKCFLAKITIAL